MKIAFNPSTVAALTTPPNNKDITFDLRGHSIFARGVEFKGTDTNTWRDIKINNVSISSHTLDLRNGSNTTLTNTNGVVTINSTWRPVVDNLTSDSTTSSLSAKQGKVLKALINGKSDSDHNHDDRYLKLTGGTMLGALNFANNTWNLVGDDSYIGDCNISGHFGIKAANTTYPGITFFNKASTFLGNLTAYSGNIKYGAYSLQFLDNGNTSVSASTQTNPFSNYNSNAVADGQAICVWGQSSYLSNLSTDTGDMTLWLRRVNAKVATLNMVLDGEYYANGNQRLAHVSEIPNKDSWNYDDRYLRLTGGWMSGDINFGGDNRIHWGRNTDSAFISFKNDGDGDMDSYMSFVTADNGNEYFRWSHISDSTNTEWMALKSDGLRVRGTKVSLEGHSHNDLYYTKAESNAKYITARKINGTLFDGTSDITTAYWGTTRTISLTGAITGSVSTNGGGNITINTTYGTGNITNLDNRYVKKAGDTMQGNLTFTSGKQTRWTAQGTSFITDGNIDYGTSLGGNLANLVISSWCGVSFTTSCSGQPYTNKTAVGINCRTGIVYAAKFVGPLQGNAANADTVDGEHASNFSYTHQSSFDFSKRKSSRIVTFDQSGTGYGWINGFASTYNNQLTSVIFNKHRSSDWYVGYMEGDMSTGETKGLQEVHKLAFADGSSCYTIFLGYLYLSSGDNGTISSTFSCLGYTVAFTYTRGGDYCRIYIPDTSFQTFYIKAAIATETVLVYRVQDPWCLYCEAMNFNEVWVRGYNGSHSGVNPLRSDNTIKVFLFGYVVFK